MRTIARLALALLAAALFAPVAHAQTSPQNQPLVFRYHDNDGDGRFAMLDLGPDPATGGRQIQVTLVQNGVQYAGSGLALQLEQQMPFTTLLTFTLVSPNRNSFFFQGKMISGITVSANGVYYPVLSPNQKNAWNIVLGGPAPATSGIRGQAEAGPIFPVERPGIPNKKPLPFAIITVQPAGGGTEITRVRANDEGRFEIGLPPGRYLIVPLPPDPSAQLPRGTPQTVTVEAGRFTNVTVEYDTGIR